MPEEINRLVTGALANLLWTPSIDADANLLREDRSADAIECVGNIMIDWLEMMSPSFRCRGLVRSLGLSPRGYGVITLHRPSNVDDSSRLEQLVTVIIDTAGWMPMVFPVHPRTRRQLEAQGHWQRLADAHGVHMLDPVGYVDFMSLVFDCAYALTDSGGIQEETTYLGIPCLTLRENTERPITVTQGMSA